MVEVLGEECSIKIPQTESNFDDVYQPEYSSYTTVSSKVVMIYNTDRKILKSLKIYDDKEGGFVVTCYFKDSDNIQRGTQFKITSSGAVYQVDDIKIIGRGKIFQKVYVVSASHDTF